MPSEISPSQPKIILVTGGNRGLGYSSIESLLESDSNILVLLGSRDLSKGEDAVKQLNKKGYQNVKAVELDTASEKSIASAAALVAKEYGYIDVLVNNAGIVAGDKPEEINDLINVNYHGPRLTTQYFAPLLTKRQESNDQSKTADTQKITPTVIYVSSLMAPFVLNEYSESFKKRVTDEKLTEDELNELVAKFHKLSQQGREALDKEYGATKLKNYGYGTAKFFLTALTAIQARKAEKVRGSKDYIFYSSVHPGYVATDMNKDSPHLAMAITPQQGAQHVLYPLQLQPTLENSVSMWYDKKSYPAYFPVPDAFKWLVYKD